MSLYFFEACVVAIPTGSRPSRHVPVVIVSLSWRTAQACGQPQMLSSNNTEARRGNKKRSEGRVSWSARREQKTRPLGGQNKDCGELD